MKVCKEKCWLTSDKKLLVEEGNSGAAFLCAIKGQEVTDAYANSFDNGDDFFETINRSVEPSHNIPVSFHEDVKPGSTNVGKPDTKEKVKSKSTKVVDKE